MAYFAFYIQEVDGKYVARYAIGENPLMKPSEAKIVISMLEKYIKETTDEEVEKENEKKLNEYRNSWNVPEVNKAESYAGGYVYLFECGGKYKSGVSRTVERRIKDLDNRPFKVNLIAKVYSEMAYKVEQTIHNFLKRYKIEGEWYDFPTVPTKEWFESFAMRVEDDTRRSL